MQAGGSCGVLELCVDGQIHLPLDAPAAAPVQGKGPTGLLLVGPPGGRVELGQGQRAASRLVTTAPGRGGKDASIRQHDLRKARTTWSSWTSTAPRCRPCAAVRPRGGSGSGGMSPLGGQVPLRAATPRATAARQQQIQHRGPGGGGPAGGTCGWSLAAASGCARTSGRMGGGREAGHAGLTPASSSGHRSTS